MARRKIVAEINDIEGIVEMLNSTGFTHQQIAYQVKFTGGKISPQTISNWLNRKVRMPQLRSVLAVAKAFNYKLEIVRNY